MLKELHISSYVLIDRLDITFNEGFSVLTGETGAGKSIILGALNLLLGGRADARSIRHGQDRCVIEGHFSIEGFNLKPIFDDLGLDYDGQDTILRRELTSAGKSRAFVNDTPVSLSDLKEVAGHLIDIHSQHQNLALGAQSFQLGTLDTIAKNREIADQYSRDWNTWNSLVRQLQELKERAACDSSELDYLKFQLEGLEKARLTVGEQEQLEQESNLLEHAQDIKQDLYSAQNVLDSEESSIIQQIRQVSQSLRSAQRNFAAAGQLADRTESCLIELKDISATVSEMAESVSFDPERQQTVSDRLDLIYSLEKKHGKKSIAELLEYQAQIKSRLKSAGSSEDDILELTDRANKAHAALTKTAARLSDSRLTAAAFIEKEVSGALIPLGIPNVRFKIELEKLQTFEKSGNDSVKFMFSANKSVPMQELSAVASGGEIARVMLSLKSMIAASRMLPTVIFDEIDTGVSGAVAQRMAALMKRMAGSDRQVLAITHLPQIAAAGQTHYKVYKTDEGDSTTTSICLLEHEQRIQEIAAMMSGETLSSAALDNAKTLIENGR